MPFTIPECLVNVQHKPINPHSQRLIAAAARAAKAPPAAAPKAKGKAKAKAKSKDQQKGKTGKGKGKGQKKGKDSEKDKEDEEKIPKKPRKEAEMTEYSIAKKEFMEDSWNLDSKQMDCAFI